MSGWVDERETQPTVSRKVRVIHRAPYKGSTMTAMRTKAAVKGLNNLCFSNNSLHEVVVG